MADTTEDILKKLYKKMEKAFPDDVYIMAENAKYLETIPGEEILFITTDKADSEKDITKLFEDSPEFDPDSKIAADRRLVVYRSDGKKFYNKDSMKDTEKRLSKNPNFIRTHISYIVNMKMVRAINKSSDGFLLVLKHTEKQVPVSQANQVEVKKYFGD